MLGDGNDTITIKANDANDYLVIDGGKGEDKVVIDGKFGEYTLSQNAQGNLIVEGSNGDTYELRNIEKIEFSDGSYNTTDSVFNDTTVSAATPIKILTDISIVGTITTPTVFNIESISSKQNGVTISAVGSDPKGSAEVSVINDGKGHDGFGVLTKNKWGSAIEKSNGDSRELGLGEKIVLKFDNEIQSLDVSFAWRAESEKALVTFYDGKESVVGSAMVSGGGTNKPALVTYFDAQGNMTKTITTQGGSDKVDEAYTFEPGSGVTFKKVEFSAPGYYDDYLINKIVYKEVVTSDITVKESEGEVTLAIQASNPPKVGTTAFAIVEVDGKEYSVQLDTNGRGTLNVPTKANEDFTARVLRIEGDGFESLNLENAQWGTFNDGFLNDAIVAIKGKEFVLGMEDFGDNRLNVDAKIQIIELPTTGKLYLVEKTMDTIVNKDGTTDSKENITRKEIDENTTLDMKDIATGKIVYESDSSDSASFKFKVTEGDNNFLNKEHTVSITMSDEGDNKIDFDPSSTIDAGAGYDTLVITGDQEIDFSKLTHAISNIEQIDLADGSQKINISIDDVLTMTDENNILRIARDDADSVTLVKDEWKLGDNITIGGAEYEVYTAVDTDVTAVLQIQTIIHTEES
jgi:hypothetical protein